MTPQEALDKAGEALKKAEEALEKAVGGSIAFAENHKSYIELAERWMMYANALREHSNPVLPVLPSYKPDWQFPVSVTATQGTATQPSTVTTFATGGTIK